MEHENGNVKYVYGPRPKQKLLDRDQEIIRLKHYSIRNRTRLPQLDATVYPFPPQTPPKGDGAS
jgi:hypothetical protein